MAKRDLNAALMQRTEERNTEIVEPASALDDIVDSAYGSIFGGASSPMLRPVQRKTAYIPMDKLRAFSTAKIGFRKYTDSDLRALADDIAANGLLELVQVREAHDGYYEILSGHNRIAACRLLGWAEMPAEVESADDQRAVIIATVPNLKRRQSLLPSERGWGYRALLEAQRCQGKRSDLEEITCGQNAHKSKTRDRVAAYFGVEVTKLRRDIALTNLIPPLLDAVDNNVLATLDKQGTYGINRLSAKCGVDISYYDTDTQNLFLRLLKSHNWQLSTSLMSRIKKECAPPHIAENTLNQLWAMAQKSAQTHPPKQKELIFKRKSFEPYLEMLGDEKALEALFLEFLKGRCR